MSIQNKTYQPLQSLTVKATQDLPAFRFVSHLGSLCADAGRAYGVTEVDWLSGEFSQVVSLGTIAIETTSIINAGEDVTSAASGKARKATGAEPVNGRALDASSGSDFIRIKLVP